MDGLSGLSPVGSAESHEIVENVTLEDFSAKPTEQLPVEEPSVFDFFQVDDPVTDSSGEILLSGLLLAEDSSKGYVFEGKLRIGGDGKEGV